MDLPKRGARVKCPKVEHRRILRGSRLYGRAIVGVVFVTIAIRVNARTAFSLLLPPHPR